MAISLPEFVLTTAGSSEDVDAAVDAWIQLYQNDPDVKACDVGFDVMKYLRGSAHQGFDYVKGYATEPDVQKRTMEFTGGFCNGAYTIRIVVTMPHVAQ